MFQQISTYIDCLGYRFTEDYNGKLVEINSDKGNWVGQDPIFRFSHDQMIDNHISEIIDETSEIHKIVATCRCPQQCSQKVKIQINGIYFSDVCTYCFPKIVWAHPKLFQDWKFHPNYIKKIRANHIRKSKYYPTKSCRACSKGDCNQTREEECRKYVWKEAPAYVRIRASFVDELIELLNQIQS